MGPDSKLRAFDPANSLLLALESATPQVSVALVRGGEVLAEREHSGVRRHAETLLPLIDELLGAAHVGLPEVDAFAISIGPGTFTSLRTGLSTLKGLAFGSDRPVAAVSTLAAVAHAANAVTIPERRLALLDARRGEFYAAAFACKGGVPELRADLLAEGVYSAGQLAENLGEPLALVGEGVNALLDEFVRDFAWPANAQSCEVFPHARSVAALGAMQLARGESLSAASLVPHYGRRAQAEENRASRAP